VAAVCDWERVAQLKSCRMSPAGGASAGCLGSTSRLREFIRLFRVAPGQYGIPSTVEILKVSMMPRIFKGDIQVFLNFGYGLQVIGDLEPLHI
jgi:hypothetical protein